MPVDYAEWFGTGKQIAVGLSRVPEGKYKTPDGDPANCRVDVYKVLDPINSKRDLVYHLEHVGFAGAVLYHDIIKRLNENCTMTNLRMMSEALIQIYEMSKEKGSKCLLVKRYQMFTSSKDNVPHIIYGDELELELDNPDKIIDEIRAVINSLI